MSREQTAQVMRFGGAFLFQKVDAQDIFTLEDKTEENRLVERTARNFVNNEVRKRAFELEAENYDTVVKLLRRAGGLGLLGHSIPEQYGGLGMDKITSCIVAEQVGGAGAYSVAHINHTGIATLPITYFGNEAMRKEYLSKLADGAYIGAYCLTEPSSGSDALSAKTSARLSEDGRAYILNGTKQFITNAGFADTFIVYAQVEGNQFTAFLVNRDCAGLSLGPEEKKMGLHGSSTRQVILEDCYVPVDKVIGEVGKGQQIALGVLNLGRFNLGAAALGGAKSALGATLPYILKRRQFGQPLAMFGLTMDKVARVAGRIYAHESLQYRTAAYLEEALGDVVPDTPSREMFERLRRYALECAICKVFGSETLQLAVDEAVQMHGGYGYIVEYGIERSYRDARINRIFEGTNEINRLLIPPTFLKALENASVDIESMIASAKAHLNRKPEVASNDLARLQAAVQVAKSTTMTLMAEARQRFGNRLGDEQVILALLADLTISAYAMESAVLRALKSTARRDDGDEAAGPKGFSGLTKSSDGSHVCHPHVDLASVFISDLLPRFEADARAALFATQTREVALKTSMALAEHTLALVDVVLQERKQRIARRLYDAKSYLS